MNIDRFDIVVGGFNIIFLLVHIIALNHLVVEGEEI